MPKVVLKTIRRLLHRAKKAIITSSRKNRPPSSPMAPPAENIYDPVKLIRHTSFESSGCFDLDREDGRHSADLMNAAELDNRLANLRMSMLFVQSQYSPSCSSTCSEDEEYEYPVIVSRTSRLTQFVQTEYFETLTTNFDLSRAPTIQMNNLSRNFSYYRNGEHFRFRNSRPPIHDCTYEDDLYSELAFSRSSTAGLPAPPPPLRRSKFSR